MTDSIDVPNADLDDALDLIDLVGYSRNIKETWEANISFSSIWFEGLTGYEVVDIMKYSGWVITKEPGNEARLIFEVVHALAELPGE